ncbi:MAG: ABC transporter substrate-binding protein [Ruminococcaceae bacterium]|nr:ABC transporter substrate-binding protein [Oscillospiraceae bacterium]
MRLRILSLAVALLLLLGLAGCSNTPRPASGSSSAASQPQPAASASAPATRQVVDMLGRTVTLPETVETAAIIYGVATNLMLPLGVADRLVAINASWGILNVVAPELADLDTVGQGAVDLEKLAQMNPDVFIHRANDQRTITAVEKLGIPVVAIEPEDTDKMLETLLLLGEVFGVTERAVELVAYYNDKVQFAQDLVADIPENARKTAIMMGSELGKVAGGDMLQSAMIETAGGINMARDIQTGQTWPVAGTEQIFSWNPDYIFCTNSKTSDYTPEGLLQDPHWSELAAVQGAHLYKMPSTVDSWEFPGLATCIGFLWMLNQMYPERYDDAAFAAEVDAYYQLAYGQTFSREFLGY